jgi:hypothetical protein
MWTSCHTFGTKAFTTCHTFLATVKFMAKKTATPWGPATVVEEVSLPQSADDKEFASLLQLLEIGNGERLLRFAYSTGGAARRGPVTIRVRDLAKLRRLLSRRRELAEVVRNLVGEA